MGTSNIVVGEIVETLARLTHAGTLLIVNALLAALSSAIFTTLHLSLRKTRHIRGLALWAASHALIAVGFSALVLPAFGITFFGLALLGNLLIDLGTAFGLVAVLVYFEHPLRFGRVLFVAAIIGAVEVLYVLDRGEDLGIMVVAGGSLKGLLTVATGIAFWRCRDDAQRLAARVAAAFHFLWAAALFLRVSWWEIHPLASGSHDPTSAFGLLSRLLLTWVITPCILWMLSRQFDAELIQLAKEDPLTGIANRRVMWELGERVAADTSQPARRFAVLIVDVDHFKRINDRWGHPGGDEALKTIATLLHRLTRAPNLLARVGGEEFMVLMVDTNEQAVQDFAEELRGAVQAFSIAMGSEHLLRCTVSIGHHLFHGGDSWNNAVTLADQALYEAKRRGRNQAVASAVLHDGPEAAR
ncbi:diguanylate cyclase (GGDEF)-like protein [Luteibacter jiangsuensis]|uniref:diguanylate cyclase n=1 Tax=Luteibacter jiangsuensis TaxID=637577 RepID=A0ABT9STR9_9GAMM|nr:GGDEF domain-containing protein [Luteibacter jiangsuensis]MDQ0008387.1 diguanylate cyclase (GGDEF)-like protein [Luteibacter jiangsuensis]